jgi:hypothetical protein
MHPSAYKNAEYFFKKYCYQHINEKIVVDVGSLNVNGTMKPIFENALKYIGIDQCDGKNVDIVGSSHNIPLPDQYADITISSSCFEHDNMFWISFLEMCRITKQNGYIYVQAPSDGPYHAYPVDNWRFYKDSWKALEEWAILSNYNIELIEGFVDSNTDGVWHDSLGIYKVKEVIHNES